ncbi:MAG: hypothetical protein IPM29_03340 [Planctomycetes bacterium]|nr:hypothetical protein [Planctomycetota bacterium]
MNAVLSALAELPAWSAGLAGLLVGLLLTRLRPRSDRQRVLALWTALDRPEPDLTEDSWTTALEQVARHRDLARESQRLQLRSSVLETRYRLAVSVLDSQQDGILVFDRSEQVLFSNATARRILGLGDQPNVCLEQADTRFEIVEGVRSVLGADLARTVKTRRIEWDHDGERFVYVIRSLTLAGHEHVGAAQVVLLEDLTAAERESRAKSEFIYGVSHELKTPLTAIQASLEIVNDDDGLTPDERNQLIRSSYDEAMRLSHMVADLLDLARVEAGITEFKRESVAMDALFASLRELHETLAERKSVALHWDISDYLADMIGDPRLLRQALVNIIGNAIKYTKEGGEVTVTGRLEGSDLVIRVRDTGIGIAEQDLPRVFEKFFRAGNAEHSRIQGTGLGLPMARYIVERHHGRIEVTSEVGVGTEFAVYLPVSTGDVDGDGIGSTLLAVDAATS